MCNMLVASVLRFYAVPLFRRDVVCRATPPYVRPPMLRACPCQTACTLGFKSLLKGMAKYIVMVFVHLMVFVPTKDEDITSIISLYRFFALPLQ